MKEMARFAKEKGFNKNMTSALKGSIQNLDWFEVPKFDCYYSPEKAELYDYDKGVFDLYASYSS